MAHFKLPTKSLNRSWEETCTIASQRQHTTDLGSPPPGGLAPASSGLPHQRGHSPWPALPSLFGSFLFTFLSLDHGSWHISAFYVVHT